MVKSRPMSFYENQLHTPKLKYDEKQKVRLFFKKGENTMLICKGLTSLAATGLAIDIERYLKRHGVSLEGHFIQTRA